MTSTAAQPVELTGRITRPGDADYPAASAGWNRLFSHRPAVIVFAQTTQDVVNALTWAQRNHVEVRVRSGGHCLEGWSNVDDGIVIDVSEMKSATVDPESNTAAVGAGLNQLEAVTALGRAGYVAPTGTEGTVGLVGATLGGGFGLLTRAYGMASDHLLAADVVVTSDTNGATAIRVDEQNNSDLLWALRGAGNGNFGVVTSLTYRVHPLAQTIYVTARWPGLGSLADVFEAWQRSAPAVDTRLTSQLEINNSGITVIGVLVSGTKAEAAQLLAPILSVGTPEVDVTDADWATTYAGFQIPTADEPANWKFLSQFITDPYPTEAINIIATFLAQAPTPDCNYFTNAFGGAVHVSEPSGGSAFSHRDALFYAEPGAGWGSRDGTEPPDEAVTAQCLQWVTEFADALAPYVKGAYVNVPNAGTPDWETAYWGPNVERLRAIKTKYDPSNVFRFPQSIPTGTTR